MNGTQQSVDDGPIRRYEYDDGTTILAADVGNVADPSVDVVDDTVIVVAGDDQYEFPISSGADAQAFIRNGVLTVEATDDSEVDEA